MPVSELVLWLKADAGRGAGNFSGWIDQSGRGNNAIQVTKVSQPLAVEGAINGRPAVRFDSTNDVFRFQNNPFSGVTQQAEAFVVVKALADSPSATRVLWNFGAGPTYYPNSDNTIVDAFGSSSFQGVGDPAPRLDQFNIYDSAASAGTWAAWLNG